MSIELMKEFITMYDGLIYLDKQGIVCDDDFINDTRCYMLEEIIKYFRETCKGVNAL